MTKLLALLLTVGLPLAWGIGTYHLFELLRRRRHDGGEHAHQENRRGGDGKGWQ
jgi:hypothetical protein